MKTMFLFVVAAMAAMFSVNDCQAGHRVVHVHIHRAPVRAALAVARVAVVRAPAVTHTQTSVTKSRVRSSGGCPGGNCPR